MGFNEWLAVINTIIGAIGVVVGIIGARSLHTAIKIKNSINNVQNSTIQQAQTITMNNGMDTYAVIKLSRDTTQAELTKIVTRINEAESTLKTVETKVDEMPKIHISDHSPTESLHDGDIWLQY